MTLGLWVWIITPKAWILHVSPYHVHHNYYPLQLVCNGSVTQSNKSCLHQVTRKMLISYMSFKKILLYHSLNIKKHMEPQTLRLRGAPAKKQWLKQCNVHSSQVWYVLKQVCIYRNLEIYDFQNILKRNIFMYCILSQILFNRIMFCTERSSIERLKCIIPVTNEYIITDTKAYGKVLTASSCHIYLPIRRGILLLFLIKKGWSASYIY
jgi:hypothetical protein